MALSVGVRITYKPLPSFPAYFHNQKPGKHFYKYAFDLKPYAFTLRIWAYKNRYLWIE